MMTPRQALAFVRKHGVVLVSARGPVPSLVEAIAGSPIRGSWWAHPQARPIYRVLQTVCDSKEIAICRLIGGKQTLVHRRVWPALVRLSGRFPKKDLAAVREEHTEKGSHRTVTTPYPEWVPAAALAAGKKLDEAKATAALGVSLPASRPRRASASRPAARR